MKLKMEKAQYFSMVRACSRIAAITIFTGSGIFIWVNIMVWLTFWPTVTYPITYRLRGIQNFSAKSLRRRIRHVMAYARNQNFSAFSNHLIFPHFLSETTVTWQIKILVQSQFQNFSAFSNNCDLTCPKLIFHDSLMTHLFFFLLVYNYES